MNGSGVFVRDPLSVQFDPMAVRLIDAAVARYAKYPDTPGTRRRGRHERLTAAQEKLERSRWQRGLLVNTLPAVTRETSGDRLSREERAFTRAMYYSPRITTMNPAQHPDAEWSLPKLPRWFRREEKTARTGNTRVIINPSRATEGNR